jgi:hypothetical protein
MTVSQYIQRSLELIFLFGPAHTAKNNSTGGVRTMPAATFCTHLSEIDDWVGPGRYPTLHSSKYCDILSVEYWNFYTTGSMGFLTFFVKVRAHRGEPYNEAADRVVYTATHDQDVPVLWNAPSGRIAYQFTPDPSESDASMNDTFTKFIKHRAALSNLYSSRSPRVTDSFLRRHYSSRDPMGACLSGSSFPEKAKKRLIQSVGFQFSSRARLHQWGREDSPNCPFCHERESLGHIQSRCKLLEKPRIVTHHMIWLEILLQLLSHSGDEGDEHKWPIPSAISADQHMEIAVRQILHHPGIFSSDDAALESKILAFFSNRTALALSQVSHLTDTADPSCFVLDDTIQVDLLARLRFSTRNWSRTRS